MFLKIFGVFENLPMTCILQFENKLTKKKVNLLYEHLSPNIHKAD